MGINAKKTSLSLLLAGLVVSVALLPLGALAAINTNNIDPSQQFPPDATTVYGNSTSRPLVTIEWLAVFIIALDILVVLVMLPGFIKSHSAAKQTQPPSSTSQRVPVSRHKRYRRSFLVALIVFIAMVILFVVMYRIDSYQRSHNIGPYAPSYEVNL